MMSCEEFQFHSGAEPRTLTWQQLLHLLLCRACARYLRNIRVLDLQIEKALAGDSALLRPSCESTTARPSLRSKRER